MNINANKENASLEFYRKAMSAFSAYLFISQIFFLNEIYLEFISTTLFNLLLCVFILISLIWFFFPSPIVYLFVSLSWILNVNLNPGINSISTSIFIIINLILYHSLFFKKITFKKSIDLCLIYLAIIYFISGLGKLASKAWLNGDAIYLLLNSFVSRIHNSTISLNLISQVDSLINWIIMMSEITLPICLIFTRYKKRILELLIFFHIIIAIFLRLIELTIPVLIILIMLRMQFARNNQKSI